MRVISSMATKAALSQLAAQIERDLSIPAELTCIGGVEVARRIRGGEQYDVVVLASGAIDALTAEGYLDPQSRHAWVQSGIAMATVTSPPRSAVLTESDVRQQVNGAARIGISTGPSGDAMRAILERWKAAGDRIGLIVEATPGVPVARLLAEAKVDVGFQQLSEMIGTPGISLWGPLPPSLQTVTTFVAAVSKSAPDRESATRFIQALTHVDTGPLLKRFGLDQA